jgi:hypothetical protein
MDVNSGRSLVIDSNMLRNERLSLFFKQSPENRAVLPDYSAIESYKGDSLSTIYRNMEILSRHPDQVIILKNTQPICGLKGRIAAKRDNLISHSATKQFGQFCGALREAQAGNQHYQNQLAENARVAVEHMETMLKDAPNWVAAIDEIRTLYTDDEFQLIRNNSEFTSDMIRKGLETTMTFYDSWSKLHPHARKEVSIQNIPNTLIFRSALCSHFLTLWWVAVGGAKGAAPAKIRNDAVDVMFAAYGTYFDGLMTNDKKVTLVHQRARAVLKAISS